MENTRLVKLIKCSVAGLLLVVPLLTFAYDDETTHPALTQEIVKLFNRSFPGIALNDAERLVVMQGSIDEDEGLRPLQHFYDPVYKRGLVLYGSDASKYYPDLAAISAAGGISFSSSKDWAGDTKAQAGLIGNLTAGITRPLFSGAEDYSWERAIYEYVWGDKKRGLESLGHILHLLEDATVPDHTRNDPHPPGWDTSPYEFWAKQFNQNNFSSIPDGKPMFLSDLDSYFDSLARYSNNNFFSKDTIFSREYNLPVVAHYSGEFGFHENDYPLLRKIKKFDGSVEYSLKDKQESIMNAYWLLLSKQAVLHGAGAIKLFFDEVEKEKQTKILYNKNRSWWQKSIDGFKETVFNTASVLYGSSVGLSDLEGNNDAAVGNTQILPQAINPPAQPQAALENTSQNTAAG
ncbi:MAG: hypothetical protein WAP51_03445, partial [Candidatus Sungiibacteriota bacterium]